MNNRVVSASRVVCATGATVLSVSTLATVSATSGSTGSANAGASGNLTATTIPLSTANSALTTAAPSVYIPLGPVLLVILVILATLLFVWLQYYLSKSQDVSIGDYRPARKESLALVEGGGHRRSPVSDYNSDYKDENDEPTPKRDRGRHVHFLDGADGGDARVHFLDGTDGGRENDDVMEVGDSGAPEHRKKSCEKNT